MDYKRPGVFVEEISTLPPSVVAVATAIPAFIGYTKQALDEEGKPLKGTEFTDPADHEVKIKRITSMLEYTRFFGGPKMETFTWTDENGTEMFKRDGDDDLPSFLMYFSVKMYFDNGGGPCYIVSVGDYNSTIGKTEIENGLTALEKEDEPTLIVIVDGIKLTDDYYKLCEKVLQHCNKLQDRFGIFDVLESDPDGSSLRGDTGVGSKYLYYGAAYTPYLKTALNYQYKDSDVKLKDFFWTGNTDENGLGINYTGLVESASVEIKSEGDSVEFSVLDSALEISGVEVDGKSPQEIIDAWKGWEGDKGGFDLFLSGNGSQVVTVGTVALTSSGETTLDVIEETHTQLYNQFKLELTKQRVTLPPSSAMAGIYASVDRDRGVWKAPANVSVSSVFGPARKVTNGEQELLNVDATSGKSINAIRSFAGKGTLVWGSRTLAGNDNEWRYVPVRRLFIFIEESLKKATEFAVFEPNTTTTWLKVKAMAESFLYNLWQRGALAGATPDAAYFVNIGLGKTMTPQDILEGRLIVEIGMAAVRPAEFIILRFMHKLQEG